MKKALDLTITYPKGILTFVNDNGKNRDFLSLVPKKRETQVLSWFFAKLNFSQTAVMTVKMISCRPPINSYLRFYVRPIR